MEGSFTVKNVIPFRVWMKTMLYNFYAQNVKKIKEKVYSYKLILNHSIK